MIKTWTERMMSENGFCEPEAFYMQAEIDELRAALKAAESVPLSDEAFDIVTSENKVLKAKLAALESQPAVGEITGDGFSMLYGHKPLPPKSKLYAAAGAAPVQSWPKEVQPDGSINDVDPADMAAGAAPVPRMTGAALASQEPVAEVLLVDGEKVIDASMAFFDSVELGTKLYLAAGAAPVHKEPVAWRAWNSQHHCYDYGEAGETDSLGRIVEDLYLTKGEL